MTITLSTVDIGASVRGWITEFNPPFWSISTPVRLQIAAHDETEQLAGGVLGEVRYGILHVQSVGVAPAQRRQGLGRRMLAALEQEGIKNGAVSALVNTLEFEAPSFYQKQGYTVIGVFGAPVGSRKVLLSKELMRRNHE